ncbi:MAG TPA: carboxypeptidase regulatory-like domain-containing protein, partial [Caldithrix sp.]|nr:carboxypeptidase regulatory-like domain-containing protein [Caldithrix sp.]
MSKPYIFFLIIILFVVSAFSQKQTGTLNGTVIDFNSEKPLPNVLLKIEGTTISSHTAKDGSFNIPNIPVGKYSLICLKSNYYSSVSDPVEIRVKKISTITLKMLPGDPEK